MIVKIVLTGHEVLGNEVLGNGVLGTRGALRRLTPLRAAPRLRGCDGPASAPLNGLRYCWRTLIYQCDLGHVPLASSRLQRTTTNASGLLRTLTDTPCTARLCLRPGGIARTVGIAPCEAAEGAGLNAQGTGGDKDTAPARNQAPGRHLQGFRSGNPPDRLNRPSSRLCAGTSMGR